jgi:hypothetical protein
MVMISIRGQVIIASDGGTPESGQDVAHLQCEELHTENPSILANR